MLVQTTFVKASGRHPARCRATCDLGSVDVPWLPGMAQASHTAAVRALETHFDLVSYNYFGSTQGGNGLIWAPSRDAVLARCAAEHTPVHETSSRWGRLAQLFCVSFIVFMFLRACLSDSPPPARMPDLSMMPQMQHPNCKGLTKDQCWALMMRPEIVE